MSVYYMTRLSSRQFSLDVTFELDEVQESGVRKSVCVRQAGWLAVAKYLTLAFSWSLFNMY